MKKLEQSPGNVVKGVKAALELNRGFSSLFIAEYSALIQSAKRDVKAYRKKFKAGCFAVYSPVQLEQLQSEVYGKLAEALNVIENNTSMLCWCRFILYANRNRLSFCGRRTVCT
jgi:hypothetical protein